MSKKKSNRSETVYVAVSPEVKQKIQNDAVMNNVSISMVIWSVLKKHYWQIADA